MSDNQHAGVVTREMILDNIVHEPDLEGDPLWDKDPITANWFRRTPEFIKARAYASEALVQQRKDAEIALAAVLISLEPELPPQQDGTPCAIAPNGLPYVLITRELDEWRGRDDDERFHRHPTFAEAIAVWKREISEFVASHPGDTLWWRCRPEISGDIKFGDTEARWLVYSRLMIGRAIDVAQNTA